ncbi:lysozyme [Sphingomonas xinjiangensis]|uniref:Lysozyme n=1 Tax=Sphingomonas xinjiangensis TaxID=643568 RepID=A0A840YA23_9SPHN|nr:lysozyme [Sphingomonas xinjiangensis]MBB5709694.1 GH24 family phage-related lysozyme (muramidase) [Sphingomonas xinjiangensis]
MNLSPSKECIDLIKAFEGCKLRAYTCSAGVPTLGWGATGPDIKLGMVWTQKQAADRLASDVAKFADGVAKIAGDCSQGQFDALVSFAFNCGLAALKSSTLLRKHISGDHAGAAKEFLRWNKAGGKVLAGLTRRRAAEAKLYAD